MHWPNADGAMVALVPFEFWESIQHNWMPE